MRLPGTLFWVWAFATFVWVVFASWYFNWRDPLTSAEVEAYMDRMPVSDPMELEQREILHQFLLGDDGKEFVMLNVIKFYENAQPHPETGELTSPAELMGQYQKHFFGHLMRDAGHPLFVARKTGGYVDTFGLSETPEYSVSAMVRYRSRRDLAEAAINVGFEGAHKFKHAAIEHTFNFPTKMQKVGIIGPGMIVPLFLFVMASLSHITVLAFRR